MIISLNTTNDNRYTYLTDSKNTDVNNKIDRFVEAMSNNSQSVAYYENKRNAVRSKIQQDIALGKKAEFIAMEYLCQEYNFPNIPIDMEIRKGRKKGWAVDLPFNEHDDKYPNVHVKSCNANTLKWCRDYSWTFQYNNNDGKGGKDKIFTQSEDTDLVALVYVETSEDAGGVVKAVMPWKEIEKSLRDPKKPSLIGLKKCIYYLDLMKDKEN